MLDVIRRYLSMWRKAKFFDELWKSGVVIYDEMKGIAFFIQTSMCNYGFKKVFAYLKNEE